jgi:hypothetical protein
MLNFILIAVLVLLIIDSLRRVVKLGMEFNKTKESLSKIQNSIMEIQVEINRLSEEVEILSLSPIEQESRRFELLPPVTTATLSALEPGEELAIAMKTYTDGGTPIIYNITYKHRETIYRNPGGKDPIAYGIGHFETDKNWADVRILCAEGQKTGVIRGLSLEGGVRKRKVI